MSKRYLPMISIFRSVDNVNIDYRKKYLNAANLAIFEDRYRAKTFDSGSSVCVQSHVFRCFLFYLSANVSFQDHHSSKRF